MWRTPSRRRSGGDLAAEALAGEGRRAGAARGLLGDHSNELCRGSLWRVILRHSMRIPAVVALGGVRCATRCCGQQPQQGVLSVRSLVSNTASHGALLLDCFMMSGKNYRTMYRLGLLFEMEKAFQLTEEKRVMRKPKVVKNAESAEWL